MSADKEDFLKAYSWLESQRFIFLWVFALGSVMIVLMRHFGAPGWLTATCAVLVMVGYVLTGVRLKFKVRSDVLGDNVYYLGFLFTLVSLSVSLYELGAGMADINKLLENFGLAIATTLVGLALRVVFNQPKADVHEYEDSVRASLTEAGANFVGSVSKIGTDISAVRSVFKQMIEEAEDLRREAAESTKEFIAEQRKILASSVRAQQKSIDTLVVRLSETQEQLNQQFEQKSDALLGTVEDAGEAMAAAASSVQTAFTRVVPLLDASAGKTAQAADKIFETIGYLGKIFSETQTLNGSLARQLDESIASLKSLSNESGGLSSEMSQGVLVLKATLDSTNKQMSEASAEFAKTLSMIAAAIQQKATSIESMDRSMGPQAAKLASAFDDLAGKLGFLTQETESYLAESKRALRELRDETREVFTSVREAGGRG